MTPTTIAFRQANGKLGLLYPVDKKLTVEEAVTIALPEGTEYKEVSAINIDNDFFDCYYFDHNSEDGALFDSDLAKEMWKDKWRKSRKPKLEALDVDFVRALESGDKDKISEIVDKKTALRDVTDIYIDGNTPEEIKAVWPDILN